MSKSQKSQKSQKIDKLLMDVISDSDNEIELKNNDINQLPNQEIKKEKNC